MRVSVRAVPARLNSASAWLFVLGASCFALGTLPAYVQAVGGELHLPPPLKDELSPRPVADPVADLVDDDGS